MAIDVQKPKGATKRSSPDAGGANPRLAPVLATVKDNVDPTRSGRIFVYVTDNSGLDPDNRDNWRPVRFLSPYFGSTRPDAGDDGYGDFKANPSSYGMWMAPPDIGTTVVCVFIDGDMNYGFYIGCVPEPEAMQMLPAIGATDNIIPNEGEAQSYGGAVRLPVTNINTNNSDVADSPEYLTAPKPVHSYSAAIMFQQGVLRDPIRGPISSSAQRETPSRVGWGVSTPGRPIYEGGFDDTSVADNLNNDKAKELRVVSRRGGHTIVMDDGDIIGRDQLIRIRTALGHQILMSDDGQTLMLLHSNGQSYIELGKEGTVDVYATNSVNIRTQGDLNLHADNNVNIHATKNLNIQGENIHINSEQEFKQRVGSDYSNFTSGQYTTKVNGPMSMESGGDISMASSAIAYVNGSKVNLNSGQTGTKPQAVPAIDKVLHTDTLFDQEKGFLAAPAKLVSITSRAPAHVPWTNAGQGVDIKTDLNADSQLPAAPSTSVQNANDLAASTTDATVPSSSIASAPPASGISSALGGKTAGALTAAAATSAAAGPLAATITQGGAAVVKTATGAVQAAAGASIPQTATQLATGGVLKPGADKLVNALAAKTGNVSTAMSPVTFTTGNLTSFAKDTAAQATSMTKNITVAQGALQSAGAITGKETASQIGGMVLSTANNGLSSTLGALGAAANTKSLGGFGSLGGKADSVMKDIAGGNFAAGVSEGLGGALSGLESSLDAKMQSPSLSSVIATAQGVSAEAFSAIKASLKPMKAGVPQNLTKLAEEAAAETETESLGLPNPTDALSQAANATKLSDLATGKSIPGAGSLGGLLPKGTGSVADGLLGATKSLSSVGSSSLSSLTSKAAGVGSAAMAFASPSTLAGAGGLSKATSLMNTAKSSVSSIASGLSTLPGGQSAASAVTNLAKGSLPSLPGTDSLKSAMSGLSTGAMTGLSNTLSNPAASLLGNLDKGASLSSSLTKGLPAGAAASLQSSLSSVATAGSGIKTPSVATNTVDRSSITQATATQLGDPAIPPPKFGEIDEAAKGKVDQIAKDKEKYNEENEELEIQIGDAADERDEAEMDYYDALDNLPPGDPGIAAAKSKWEAAVKKVQALVEKSEALYKNNPGFSVASEGSTTTNSTANSNSNTPVTTVKTGSGP
jgi:hypothetical protein